MTGTSSELIALFSAKDSETYLHADLKHLSEVMTCLASSADAALIKAIHLQEAITRTRAPAKAPDAVIALDLDDQLLCGGNELEEKTKILAKAILDFRSQFKSTKSALECLASQEIQGSSEDRA